MHKLIWIGAFAVIALAAFSFVPPPARPQPEAAPPPALSGAERDSVAENYVRTNIAALSPEPAVLGGTYYVTAVHAAAGTGVVSYEDGHMAYTADFTYTADAGGRNITVTSFVIRE
ncbi:MAG TPA: hypothetical protein VEA36_00190 [Candidatus Paceibacterota bacterium]|nr:hypothetical protein [Candidatus Paceibacterota bacterium]